MQAQRARTQVDENDYEEDHEAENIDTNQFQAVCFRKIEELENYGINKTDVKKLKDGGYNTIQSVSS